MTYFFEWRVWRLGMWTRGTLGKQGYTPTMFVMGIGPLRLVWRLTEL